MFRARRSTTAGIAVGAVVLMAMASPAALARTGRPPAQKVSFTTASGPPIPGTPTCDSAGACLAPISGGPESTVTGDLEGTGVYAGAALLIGSDEAISSAVATFTGTVDGCGTGTATIRYDAHYGADLPHGGGGTWEVVDDVGTGDLSEMTGGGTFIVGTIDPADLSGTNIFKGRIRC